MPLKRRQPERVRSRPSRLNENALRTPPGVAKKRDGKRATPPKKTRTPSFAKKAPRKSTAKKGPRKKSYQQPEEIDNCEQSSTPERGSPRKKRVRGLSTSPVSPASKENDIEHNTGDSVVEGTIVEENVQTLDEKTVIVTVKRSWSTAVECPCEKEDCRVLIRVGKYGDRGNGKAECEHCGQGSLKSAWNNVAELRRHVYTNACRSKQGLPKVVRKTPKQLLGRRKCHDIDNVDNFYEEVDDNGGKKQRFQCPKCSGKMNWSERFAHCVRCYDLQ